MEDKERVFVRSAFESADAKSPDRGTGYLKNFLGNDAHNLASLTVAAYQPKAINQAFQHLAFFGELVISIEAGDRHSFNQAFTKLKSKLWSQN